MLLQVSGLKELGNTFKTLTSRDPDIFCTSGQWMTEKRGMYKEFLKQVCSTTF